MVTSRYSRYLLKKKRPGHLTTTRNNPENLSRAMRKQSTLHVVSSTARVVSQPDANVADFGGLLVADLKNTNAKPINVRVDAKKKWSSTFNQSINQSTGRTMQINQSINQSIEQTIARSIDHIPPHSRQSLPRPSSASSAGWQSTRIATWPPHDPARRSSSDKAGDWPDQAWDELSRSPCTLSTAKKHSNNHHFVPPWSSIPSLMIVNEGCDKLPDL